jgi:hypothetical protein
VVRFFTLWAIGGVLTWTTFLGLQARRIARHVGLPAWLQRPMAVDRRRFGRNPVWLMVCARNSGCTADVRHFCDLCRCRAGFTPVAQPERIEPLALMHAVVIPIVIGGAGERGGATPRHASWQTLCRWRRLAVDIKVAVAVLLTAVLVPWLPFCCRVWAGRR